MVSNTDHCLRELLWRREMKDLVMDVPLIISNHDKLRPLAELHGIPYHHLPISKEPGAKEEQERQAQLAQLGRAGPFHIERLEVDGSHDAAARSRVAVGVKLRRDLCGNQPVRQARREI